MFVIGRKKMSELEKAKKVIMDHLDELCTVKSTRWVYNEEKKEYEAIDAGYSKEEMEIMRKHLYRDYKQYFKLRELLEEWI